MTSHNVPAPIKHPFFTIGTKILLVIAGLGIVVYIYRLFVGLGAVTNLDNQYPWGLWISIDVVTGVALAAGGFTTAALAYIFHREEYHMIVRPALLTAMLGYTFVAIGIVADLGRFYNIWHPALPSMWQGNSVLFEVAVCVMLYLTVLYIEFVPIVVERFMGKVNLPKLFSIFNKVVEIILKVADKTLVRITAVFIIAGVVLSCLHQSSLGTLIVFMPNKMHPLWYSSISPLFFLLSAIAVGFPMVIFESILASRSFKLKPEMHVLSRLSGYLPFLLGLYLAVKIVDLTIRGAWPYLLEGSPESFMFIIEIVGGVIIPMALLSFRRFRNSVGWLFTSATMIVLGVVLNRINVFLVAYTPLYPIKSYFPSPYEITLTAGLIALLVLLYRVLVMIFPIITVPVEKAN